MSDREAVRRYLTTLSRHLWRLERAEAKEVLREIESHLNAVLDEAKSAEGKIDIEEVLARFGPPEELAERYIEHVLEGSAPPPGFGVITRVERKVTTGLYWATAISGYGVAAGLLALALLKPFLPSVVGLWSDERGEGAVLGILSQPPNTMNEVLGWWLIPLAVLCALVVGYLTRRILTALNLLR